MKDFLELYNKLVHHCFDKCVSNFNHAKTSDDEVGNETLSFSVIRQLVSRVNWCFSFSFTSSCTGLDFHILLAVDEWYYNNNIAKRI